MKPRILFPVPTSTDAAYNSRSIANYANAVRQAGGDPVELPLNLPPSELLAIARTTQGILLPGSPADVDPARFGQPPAPECAAADPAREAADNLLIEHAERTRTPLLCICFGTQSLNVYRGGTLVQHLAPIPVNHSAGKAVSIAHTVNVAPESHLGHLITSAHNSAAKDPGVPYLTAASSSSDVGSSTTAPGAPYLAAGSEVPGELARGGGSSPDVGSSTTETSANTEDHDNLTDRNGLLHLNVNSSHHQAIGIPGEGLRIVARSSEDNVIEAIENDPTYKPKTQSNTADSTTADKPHWLLALQWHPERTTEISSTSRAIFHDFIAAATRQP